MSLLNKKLFLIPMIGVLLTSILVGLTNVTFAAPVDTAKLEDKVKSYIYYTALEDCFANSDLSSQSNNPFSSGQWVTPDDARSGYFFVDTLTQGKHNTNIGYLGGTVSCGDTGWVQQALRFWGWTDNIVALCDFGFTRDSGNCLDGQGNFIPSNDRVTDFKRAVEQKYYGKTGRPSLTGAEQYLIYFNSFKIGCNATPVSPLATASPSDKTLTSSDTGYLVDVLDPTTYQKVPTIFKAEKGKGEQTDIYAGETISCEEAVNRTNQNFAAYSAYMSANKGKETPVDINGGGTSGTGEDSGNDCGDAGFVLGWIICPIGSALAEGTKVIDNTLYSLLYIDTSSWETSGVKAAWENFRVISSVLIVLVALIGIASQVFNFDFLSAYTIRKIIPKLFIAVILIQLSWFLATMAINISNTVGFSVQALLSAPFENIATQASGDAAGNISSTESGDDGWIGFADVLTVYADNSDNDAFEGAAAGSIIATSGIVAAIFSAPVLLSFAGGVGGAAAVGVPAIMTFLIAIFLPAFLAILTAFVVIILRVVLLLALTMVLPLAIVAWILPSTKKWFDRWWGMFFALLAFFPIMITFITAGKIASLILATSAGYSGLRNIVLLIGVIVAYFIPYFLIFKLMKFSGGALGKIQGAIDNVKGGVNRNEALQGWRNKQKESAKHYSDEQARRKTENSRNVIEGLEGKKGFRNSVRRNRARLQQNAYMGQLGNAGYFGEEQERKLDETVDKSKGEAAAANSRILRSLDADQSTEYLEKLASAQFDSRGRATIKVGDKSFEVTDTMWAASLPMQKDFKNNIDGILERSKSTDNPHLAAIAKRVIADNGAMVDGMATDFSRAGTILEDFVSDSSYAEVREITRDKMYNDPSATQKAVAKVQERYDKKHGKGSFVLLDDATKRDVIDKDIDEQINESAQGIMKTIRAKQTANYKDLPGHRRDKVKDAIRVLSNGTEEQQKEAIGLAMQLVSQGRDLTGADITDISAATGVDIETVFKSGGNQTFTLEEVKDPSTGQVVIDAATGKAKKQIVVTSASGSGTTSGAQPAPRRINLTITTAGGGQATQATSAAVAQEVTNAGGIDQLTPTELSELWQHANTNWAPNGDPQGTQLGLDAEEELRKRGVLPPRP